VLSLHSKINGRGFPQLPAYRRQGGKDEGKILSIIYTTSSAIQAQIGKRGKETAGCPLSYLSFCKNMPKKIFR